MDGKKLIAGALAAAALTFGGGAAIAAGPGQEQAAGSQAAGETEEQEPSFTGSVKAPAENEAADDSEDAAEDRELQRLARIDEAAAEDAALQAVPGTAEEAELDEENGYVVYEVEVAGEDGRPHDVGVDAGNGDILYRQADQDDDSDDTADDDVRDDDTDDGDEADDD